MAVARKLPSGSWRCLVYSHTDENGKRRYKSFTCKDPSPQGKRICEKAAAEWAAQQDRAEEAYTLGQAYDDYIALRTAVLAPRTLDQYRSIRAHHLQALMDVRLNDITQKMIQFEINEESRVCSPKTVRNIHGLLSAVLLQYRPDLRLNTALPKKVRPKLYVPTDADITRLIAASAGTELELPILLAVFGPMRRGEICALDSADILGNTVHVYKTMTKTKGGWKLKAPKSYAGDRFIVYPDAVAQKWQGIEGPITSLHPNGITKRFPKLLKKAGLPHFRFHDLRHYSASALHAIGIADQYIMQRGGWASDDTLKEVYRHTIEEKQKAQTQLITDHMTIVMQHGMQHENPKSPI